MYISNMYKYEKDGVIYVAGDVPRGATIVETMYILNAENGYDLVRKSDLENVGSNIWLKNDDTQDNYGEVIHIDPEPPRNE